jgi:hypothetical protein
MWNSHTAKYDLPPPSFYQQHEMEIVTGIALGSLLVAALLIRGGWEAWENRAKVGNTIIDALAVGLRQYRKLAVKVRTLRTEIENRASMSEGNPPPQTAPKLSSPTAAEQDEMSGRAFLEVFRELSRERERRSKPRLVPDAIKAVITVAAHLK